MVEFSILTQRYEQKIIEKVKGLIEAKRIPSNAWQCREEGALYSIVIQCAKKEKDTLVQDIARNISDIVETEVVTRFASKYLKEKYELTKDEKECIKELFLLNHYAEAEKEEGVSYVSYYIIYTPILRELETFNQVNLDGWIQFRTKKYAILLEDVMEQMIYDYKTQKEYLECIRFIVALRRGQGDSDAVLHLKPTTDGKVRVLNQQKEDVTEAYITMYCQEILEEEDVTSEDLIMNILVTVPPEELVLHGRESYENKRFISTVEMVFEEDITYCTGCELCICVKSE